MTNRKHTTHGVATSDAKLGPPYRKATTNAGWTEKRVQPYDHELTDPEIAKKYGKNKSILVTEDKTAHTNNVPQGFIGYVYLDSTTKDEESEYVIKYENLMRKISRKDIEGHYLYLPKSKKSYEKKKLPKTKATTG
ncbi:hypothetical protein HGA88_01235 [Candidatus Roizmanbacteria bacterium]|nr:hypothetical protein [Candidatus Roizmanbacteria bacterium]